MTNHTSGNDKCPCICHESVTGAYNCIPCNLTNGNDKESQRLCEECENPIKEGQRVLFDKGKEWHYYCLYEQPNPPSSEPPINTIEGEPTLQEQLDRILDKYELSSMRIPARKEATTALIKIIEKAERKARTDELEWVLDAIYYPFEGDRQTVLDRIEILKGE